MHKAAARTIRVAPIGMFDALSTFTAAATFDVQYARRQRRGAEIPDMRKRERLLSLRC
jgi:hypothetical protein